MIEIKYQEFLQLFLKRKLNRMMRKCFSGIVFAFLTIMNSFAGHTAKSGDSAFEIYVDSILWSSESRWTDYPKSPPLTEAVLKGLQKELLLDSTKYYFEKLHWIDLYHRIDYKGSMNYFERNNCLYSFLGMSVHSNPDIRVFTMMSMNQSLKLRKGADRKITLTQEDKVALRFLIYMFEYYPKFISGSENSTIHDIYLSNIAWNIDLLTNENFTSGKKIIEWYTNEAGYQTVLKKWKEHLEEQ